MNRLQLACLAICLWPLGAFGQVGAADLGIRSVGQNIDQTVIRSHALGNVRGAVGVNMAAGDSNLQVNAAALAATRSGVASAVVGAVQAGAPARGRTHSNAVARIDGHSFRNATGWIAVNQASGSANAQANGFAVALGIEGEALTDSVLAQSLPDVARSEIGSARSLDPRSVSLSNSAFRGARGVVQVNQSAGSSNTTTNSFALRISLGVKP